MIDPKTPTPWDQAVANYQAAVAMTSCAAREPGIIAAGQAMAAFVRVGQGDAGQLAQLLEAHLPRQIPQFRQVLTDDDLIAELQRGETSLTIITLMGCEAVRDWSRIQQFAERLTESKWLAVPEMERSQLICLVVRYVAFFNYPVARQLFELTPIAETTKNLGEAKFACGIGKAMQSMSEPARFCLADLCHGYQGQVSVALHQEIVAQVLTLPVNHGARKFLRKQFPHLFGQIRNGSGQLFAFIMFFLCLTIVISVWIIYQLPPAMGLAIIGAIGFGIWRRTR